MIQHEQVIFHLKRYSMTNVYISGKENLDLLDNLSTTEMKLYTVIKTSVLQNVTSDFFKSDHLATVLNVSKSTIDNAKSSLKNKGYLLLLPFKDETGLPVIRVVIGKDVVKLYNLGLKVSISDAKAYDQMLKKYDLLNPSLTDDERKELVNRINEEYKQLNHQR